jgi:hypothetical protein
MSNPFFIRCYADRLEYYNLFENREHSLSLDELLNQLQGENPELLSYLVQLFQLNTDIKKSLVKQNITLFYWFILTAC